MDVNVSIILKTIVLFWKRRQKKKAHPFINDRQWRKKPGLETTLKGIGTYYWAA